MGRAGAVSAGCLRRPKEVAGCPPDAFSDAGQLWGNPLYDWAPRKNRLCLVGAAHPLCPEFLRYSAHRPFPRLRHLLCHPLRREDRPNGRVAQRPGHEAVSRREAGAGGCAHRGRGLGRAVSQRI
ncbi:MAG: 4-alpha-glucanotransferase [Ruthenibacterium lactatiformans]